MLLARAQADGRVEDEGWRVRKDGSRFWADVVTTPLVDEDSRLVGFAKVTRDLTERREQEHERARHLAAERSAERFSRLQMATAALSATTEPALAAQVLVDVGLGMLGADAGLVALASPEQVSDGYSELLSLRAETSPFSAWALVPLSVKAQVLGVCAFSSRRRSPSSSNSGVCC